MSRVVIFGRAGARDLSMGWHAKTHFQLVEAPRVFRPLFPATFAYKHLQAAKRPRWCNKIALLDLSFSLSLSLYKHYWTELLETTWNRQWRYKKNKNSRNLKIHIRWNVNTLAQIGDPTHVTWHNFLMKLFDPLLTRSQLSSIYLRKVEKGLIFFLAVTSRDTHAKMDTWRKQNRLATSIRVQWYNL